MAGKGTISITAPAMASNAHLRQIYDLYADLAEVQNQIDTLEDEKNRLRADISLALAEFDRPVEIPGVAKLEITAPSQVISYDRAGLDDLLGQLAAEGHQAIVERITRCRKIGHRTGGLRVVRVQTDR